MLGRHLQRWQQQRRQQRWQQQRWQQQQQWWRPLRWQQQPWHGSSSTLMAPPCLCVHHCCCRRLMPQEQGVESWVWVMDLYGFGLRDCDPRLAHKFFQVGLGLRE